MTGVQTCALPISYPFFPQATDIWSDGPNWRLGHWLTGRLGAVSLAALVRRLCLRAGLADTLIDVSGLWGAVEGYVITALESPRASISMLAQHFGFDAARPVVCHGDQPELGQPPIMIQMDHVAGIKRQQGGRQFEYGALAPGPCFHQGPATASLGFLRWHRKGEGF